MAWPRGITRQQMQELKDQRELVRLKAVVTGPEPRRKRVIRITDSPTVVAFPCTLIVPKTEGAKARLSITGECGILKGHIEFEIEVPDAVLKEFLNTFGALKPQGEINNG